MKRTYNRKLGQWIDETFQDEKRIEKMQMTPTNEQETDVILNKRKRKRADNSAERPE